MLRQKKEELAATTIQRFFRGFVSRKKTNTYGKSQGKEIEVYLPWGIKKKNCDEWSYKMIEINNSVIYESDLFSIHVDFMTFSYRQRVKIPEIVTAPFRQPGETKTNLLTEEEIDEAVSDFLSLIEIFTQQASHTRGVSFIYLDEIIKLYNDNHPKHPLRMPNYVRNYLNNPHRKELFSEKCVPVEEHQNIDLCFIFDPSVMPRFDESDTPRTSDASKVISETEYREGKLLVHIQKTFSLSVEEYMPNAIHQELNNTAQQLEFFKEARRRSEKLIDKHPLPIDANKERVLGLLTICAEQVLSVTKAKEYKGLHEKIDRPILTIRHILHYVKKNTCNETELTWFNEMFKKHYNDVNDILCENVYTPDHRDSPFGLLSSYDVVFDLFAEFANQCDMSQADINNPLSVEVLENLNFYGINSWSSLFNNHIHLNARTHLNLQKVINEQGKVEYHPLFEARRIGLMTIDEFKDGKSRISPAKVKETSSPDVGEINSVACRNL